MAFHITWATYGSRTSQRMIDHKKVIEHYRIRKSENPLLQAIELTDADEIEITEYIAEIVKKDNLRVLAYNICRDHIHIVIVCDDGELSRIVRKIKSVTARKFNFAHGKTIPVKNTGASPHAPRGFDDITRNMVACPLVDDAPIGSATPTKWDMGACPRVHKRGQTQNRLWAQKFNWSYIETDERLANSIAYTENNRIKHNLEPNEALEPIIRQMLSSEIFLFVTEVIAIGEER